MKNMPKINYLNSKQIKNKKKPTLSVVLSLQDLKAYQLKKYLNTYKNEG